MRDVYVVSTTKVSVADDCPELVHAMLAYMAQHCESATLPLVAEHFSLHPNTAGRMIKAATGLSFSQQLHAMRMSRAVSLLRCGGVPVAQVAGLCGYDNPASFYRAFREEFSTTPRAYAERLGRAAVCA